jgi:hypothetical protein
VEFVRNSAPRKKTAIKKNLLVAMLTLLNAVVCTREGTLAVCLCPTSWCAYYLVYASRGRGILLSIFLYSSTANLDSGDAVLGKKFWS